MGYHDLVPLWKNLMLQGLEDDGWPWDWTTLGCLRKPEQRIRARVIAKSRGVWAAGGLCEALNEQFSQKIATASVSDGDELAPGQIVAKWSGPARLILALERPFLNLASYAGGIATETRSLTDRVRRACPKRPPRVTSTRKTLPGYRDVAIHAVRVGGGVSHRVSLSGGVLIKENHIAAAGGIRKAIEGARRISPHGLKIEIEVRSLKELSQALAAQAEAVLLDNFSPPDVRTAVRVVEKAKLRPVLEVSGGLNAGNIADYAIEGVDVLSVGSLTHSVRALDLSLLVQGL